MFILTFSFLLFMESHFLLRAAYCSPCSSVLNLHFFNFHWLSDNSWRSQVHLKPVQNLSCMGFMCNTQEQFWIKRMKYILETHFKCLFS